MVVAVRVERQGCGFNHEVVHELVQDGRCGVEKIGFFVETGSGVPKRHARTTINAECSQSMKMKVEYTYGPLAVGEVLYV